MNNEYLCAQCRDALPGYVAGTLALATRAMVDSHLATCAACEREYAQWRSLATLAYQADAQTPPEHALSAAGTWAAIQAGILSESPFTAGALTMDFDQHDAPFDAMTTPPTTRAHAGRTPTRRRVSVVAIAAALLLVAFAATIFAFHPRLGSAPSGSGEHPTPTPTSLATDSPAEVPAGIIYTASAALSPTDAWAVGNGSQRGGAVYVSAISHFDGTQWQIGQHEIFTDSDLRGISMDSATDGWAVGAHTDSSGARKPLLVHYTQGQWVSQTLTNYDDAVLEQVQMFGADDGWAMGGDTANGPFFLHYHQGVWTPTTFAPTPVAAATAYYTPLSQLPPGVSQIDIQQVQFISDSEGWAWGQDHANIMLWRFHNSQWQTVFSIDSTAGASFFGMGVNAANDVWLLGSAPLGNALPAGIKALASKAPLSNGGTPILLHYDGHSWTKPALPDIDAGAPFLAGATWLANYGVINQKQQVTGLLLNQHGHWVATTFAQPVTHVLSATSAPDGSTLVVAANGEESGPQTPQLLRYANGSWSSV